MAQDIVTEIDLFNETTALVTETTSVTDSTTNSNDVSTTEEVTVQFSSTENYLNTSDTKQLHQSDTYDSSSIFLAFIIIEIVMTALELIISISAAIKIRRWRRNYRNQMLTQLSLARFIKRIIFLLQYFEDQDKISTNAYTTYTLSYCQFYIDFVIVILVFFFIKHMYNSLIIVLVKISQNNLYKVLSYAWLLPVPISAGCVAMIATNLMKRWWVYLSMCCIFRWPMIFLGTSLYVMILYKVMSDKIRNFARSLTVVTFLMCLIINVYLFSKDVIELWCNSSFLTILISYISGFLMNVLILCLYIILLLFNLKNRKRPLSSLPNYSLTNIK